jgi:hypothetical protein
MKVGPQRHIDIYGWTQFRKKERLMERIPDKIKQWILVKVLFPFIKLKRNWVKTLIFDSKRSSGKRLKKDKVIATT